MIEINDKLKVYFPLKYKPREQQIESLEFLKKSINSGIKYCLINSPMGSGKSFLVNMFINYYRNHVNSKSNFDIITNSRFLQKQYINDFPFIKNFEGRSNYYCDRHSCSVDQAREICKVFPPGPKDCGINCPYEKAKQEWLNSEIGLTNFHLFNTLALYQKSIFDSRNSNVLIVDEAHLFEDVFCDYISTTTSAKLLKKYGFDLKKIENYDEIFRKIKTIDQYVGFIENQFISDIEKLIIKFEEQIKRCNKKLKEEYSKYSTHCSSQLGKYKNLISDYKINPENWVLDISINKKDKMYSGILLEAKTVWVNNYLEEYVWKKYDHIILMSGTILNREMFIYINGLDIKDTSYFDTPSTFPLENRPIYYLKVGKMNMDQKTETFKKQIPYIKKILNKYKNDKGFIHCNYEICEWLQEKLIDKRLIFHNSDNRDQKLAEHINADYPSVIVSPISNGIDFKDDLSRFQILLKLDYPYLGSNKVKQRQKTNSKWYSWLTTVNFMQTCGRSNRSVDDWCHTFVLDSCLDNLLKYDNIMPRWFTNSIINMKL